MQLDEEKLEFKCEMMDYIEDKNINEVETQNTTEQVDKIEGDIEVDLDTDILTQ